MDQTQTTGLYMEEDRQRSLVHALSRAEGHVGGIKRMVEERRCADELLTQLAAVRAALTSVAVKIVEEELRLCLTQCGAEDSEVRFDRAMKALGSMLKRG